MGAALDRFFEGLVSVVYVIGAYLVGIPTFLWCWWYAIETYGWFLGGGLGWIPSLFIAYIVGAGWPLWAVLVLFLFSRATPPVP